MLISMLVWLIAQEIKSRNVWLLKWRLVKKTSCSWKWSEMVWVTYTITKTKALYWLIVRTCQISKFWKILTHNCRILVNRGSLYFRKWPKRMDQRIITSPRKNKLSEFLLVLLLCTVKLICKEIRPWLCKEKFCLTDVRSFTAIM